MTDAGNDIESIIGAARGDQDKRQEAVRRGISLGLLAAGADADDVDRMWAEHDAVTAEQSGHEQQRRVESLDAFRHAHPDGGWQ